MGSPEPRGSFEDGNRILRTRAAPRLAWRPQFRRRGLRPPSWLGGARRLYGASAAHLQESSKPSPGWRGFGHVPFFALYRPPSANTNLSTAASATINGHANDTL